MEFAHPGPIQPPKAAEHGLDPLNPVFNCGISRGQKNRTYKFQTHSPNLFTCCKVKNCMGVEFETA